VIGKWKDMEQSWNDTDRGKQRYWDRDRNRSQCYCVHHKYRTHWSGIEPGPTRWPTVFPELLFSSQRAWTVTTLGAGWTNPGRGNNFSNLQKSKPVLRTTERPTQKVPGVRQRVKRPGREVDHSHQSSVKVKNDWSYTYICPPHMPSCHGEGQL